MGQSSVVSGAQNHTGALGPLRMPPANGTHINTNGRPTSGLEAAHASIYHSEDSGWKIAGYIGLGPGQD
jgi:hypothetical protein